MLDLDPSKLYEEIKSAETFRAQHLRTAAELMRQFVGNYYSDHSKTKPIPENLLFSYVASILPQIVFDNPAVKVSAKKAVSQRDIARWMDRGLGQWIKEVGLRDELEVACIDFLFSYLVLKVGVEPRGDYAARPEAGVGGAFNQGALRPYLLRISPSKFIIDSQATDPDSARLLGHEFQRDLEDLKQDPRYDQSVIARLSEDNEGGRARETAFPLPNDATNRHRVTLYELYLPEYKQIGTISVSGEPAWVRPLTPYRGPAAGAGGGPYVFGGCLPVPEQVYPLSVIAAMAEAFQSHNAHAAAAADEANTQKELVLVDERNNDLNNAVISAATGSVIRIKNFDPNMVKQVTVGGTSKARLAWLEYSRQMLDRQVGFSDAQRGRSAGGTATEAAITDANADARTDYLHLRFRELVKRALTKAGWYLFNEASVVMPLSWKDEESGEDREGLFMGGTNFPGQEEADWDDFELDIEPYSMRRIDPAVEAQQAQQMLQLVMEIAPVIPQTASYINWPAILDAIGESQNVPDFAERVLTRQGLAMIMQSMAQPPGMMGMMGPDGMPGGPMGGPMGAPMGGPPPMGPGMMPPPGAMPGGPSLPAGMTPNGGTPRAMRGVGSRKGVPGRPLPHPALPSMSATANGVPVPLGGGMQGFVNRVRKNPNGAGQLLNR